MAVSPIPPRDPEEVNLIAPPRTKVEMRMGRSTKDQHADDGTKMTIILNLSLSSRTMLQSPATLWPWKEGQ